LRKDLVTSDCKGLYIFKDDVEKLTRIGRDLFLKYGKNGKE